MIETILRPNYQRFFVDPIAHALSRIRFITPIRVTLLAVIMGMCSAVLIIWQHTYLAVLCLLLSGFFDSLDGTLARVTGQASDQGAALDIVGDRIVEFVIIFAFYLLDPSRNALGALAMLGASYLCVTTFLVVGIFSANEGNKSFHYSAGLMERAEAFVFFIVMMLAPVTFAWLAWVYFILVLYTAGLRVVEFTGFSLMSWKKNP